MKYLISERQYNLIKEDREVLEIPSLEVFGDDWDLLQRFLEKRGNPPYSISGDLILRVGDKEITSLGNLVSVGGELNLYGNKLTSLENLTSVGGHLVLSDSKIISLGNLHSVGGDLVLSGTKIKSFGDLKTVGGDLYIYTTPFLEKNKKKIRRLIDVGGNIMM